MKPILMNTEMVKAMLANRKTVTRRLVKPQPKGQLEFIAESSDKKRNGKWAEVSPVDKEELLWTPPCHSRDVLYVRETWQHIHDLDGNEQIIEGTGRYIYAADDLSYADVYFTQDEEYIDHIRWRPSIHMPKEAARIFLRVTNVRVERLQDIEEGWRFDEEGIILHHGMISEAWRDYADLWNSTVKKADLDKYGWKANPWVWVIEFERIGKEEAKHNDDKRSNPDT